MTEKRLVRLVDLSVKRYLYFIERVFQRHGHFPEPLANFSLFARRKLFKDTSQVGLVGNCEVNMIKHSVRFIED